MQYGAKGLRFAPFASDYTPVAGKAPAYGTPVTLSPLVKVTENPTFNTVKAHGDDRVTGQMSEFKECPITVEVNDLPNATAAAVLGGKLDGEKGELVHGANDTAPYGGLVYHIRVLLPDSNNKKVWRSYFFPQVQSVMQGRDYTTKGDTLVLANEKLMMNAIAAMDENWRYDSTDFDTEAEAIAWENTQLGYTPAAT